MGSNCSLSFFSGYKKTKNGIVNVNNNQPMVWKDKLQHAMDNNLDLDCINIYDDSLVADGCGLDYCTICETENKYRVD